MHKYIRRSLETYWLIFSLLLAGNFNIFSLPHLFPTVLKRVKGFSKKDQDLILVVCIQAIVEVDLRSYCDFLKGYLQEEKAKQKRRNIWFKSREKGLCLNQGLSLSILFSMKSFKFYIKFFLMVSSRLSWYECVKMHECVDNMFYTYKKV